ncbi:MAG: alpha-L-fucosidase [Clostridiales bacterium]|nr:alpha-L-fucosidase [Clostridiales bacterium]
MMDVAKLVAVRPDERQIAWQSLGFTAFLHFGVNTFTNREWGTGKEDPAVFAPTSLDTDQWCAALASAGITACILTAKHHDGFCLWNTAHTRHSVMSSSARTDVVQSLSDYCRRFGLKLGLYLSPWDMHEPTYGTGKPYNDFFCAQLEELITRYGALYALWFDGACGEGENGKKQEYDWERYFALIRKNQPDAVISSMGPDVRWIGNEAGITRESEWSVVSARLQDHSKIAASSQQADGLPPLSPETADLGSAAALQHEPELCWYPAEVDVSIRPGWFYHPEENDKVRTLDDLLHIYETSVGGNAVLLLNVPPDTDGRIHAADVRRLQELGDVIGAAYGSNLCADASAHDGDGNDISYVLHDDDTCWRGDGEPSVMTVTFPSERIVQRVVLCEQIRESQRIEAFEVVALTGRDEQVVFRGTTVGFKKMCRFAPIPANRITITVQKSRQHPTIRLVEIY